MKRIGYRELGRCGRLGNQLWQIASTLGFARTHGVEPLFPADWDYRPWFSLPDEWFGSDRELARAVPAQRCSGLPGIQTHYLQQHSYVRDVLPEVQEVLAPSDAAVEVIYQHLRETDQGYLAELADDAITLHVRRGDNLNPDTHPPGTWPLVTMTYYRSALRVLDATTERPVVIFSDNPEWAVENVGDLIGRWRGCVYVVTDGPTRPPEYEPGGAYAASPPMDWLDLQLMAMFSRHVVAASTYSLWGAMLGPGPTTYPNNWVGWRCREQVPEESTMVPPEWVMVENPVPREELYPCSSP